MTDRACDFCGGSLAGRLARGDHRLTVQCDRCGYGSHTDPPRTLPEFWERNVLGEILCPLCVERAAKKAGRADQVGDAP